MLDGYLSDENRPEEKSVDVLQRDQAVTQRCSHGDKGRRSVRRLDKMLLRLQTKHQDRLVMNTHTKAQTFLMITHSIQVRLSIQKKVL